MRQTGASTSSFAAPTNNVLPDPDGAWLQLDAVSFLSQIGALPAAA